MLLRLTILALCAVSTAASAAAAAELLMVRKAGCPWCLRWDAVIAPVYPKTEESIVAPLREVDVREMSKAGVAFDSAVLFTPTFVLAEDGREVGRIEGYAGDEFFWVLLDQLLDKLSSEPREEEP